MFDKKKYHREYYHNNKKKYLAYIKKYSTSKKGRKKIKEYTNREDIKFKRNKNRSKKVKNDKSFSKKRVLYSTFRRILIRFNDKGIYGLRTSTIKRYKDLYGIDFIEIIKKNLLPLPENLNDYDIDHINPLCNFDFTKKEDIKKAYSPSNIRLIYRGKNQLKGGRLS